MSKMTDDEYQTTQETLMQLAAIVYQLDIQGFLERISTAESVAPIADPTLWIRGSGKLEQVKRIAQVAQGAAQFKAAVKEVAEAELQQALVSMRWLAEQLTAMRGVVEAAREEHTDCEDEHKRGFVTQPCRVCQALAALKGGDKNDQ